MKSERVIRPARRDDLAVLGRLGAELVRVHHEFDPDRFLVPGADIDQGYAWFLGTRIVDPDSIVLVAEEGGEILGYVYAGLEPLSWKELRGPAGFIHDVVVDEKVRGTGIATQLIEAAAERLEVRGAPRIMLWTAEKNLEARRLFEHLGFRRTMVEMTRESRRK